MYVINNKNYYNKIYAPDTKHKMKIKLDDYEIDSKYLRKLTLKDEAFSNDYFALGGVTLCEVELEINKEAFRDITFNEGSVFYFEEVVTVDEEDISIPIGYFYVHLDLVDTENEYTNNFILYDRLYDLMNENIDFSEQVKSGTFTRLDLVKLICGNYDIELGSESFINSNKVVGTYDNQLSIITWLGFVSERAGGFAKIGRDGKLYIKSYGDVDEITISTTAKGEIEKSDVKAITGVTYQNATQSITAGNNDGLVVYLSQDNYFSCSQDEVDAIYESLNGLQFQSLKVRIWGDSSIDTGDIIKVGDYITFCQKDWEYGQGFYGYYNTQLSETKSSLEVKKLNNNQKLRRAYTLIDEVNGKIDLMTEDVSETNEKVSEIEIDVDGLSSKVSETKTEINELNEAITVIKSTMLEQTNEAFTMWFEQTGLKGDIDEIQKQLENGTEFDTTLKDYIHFEGAEITLGKAGNQTKLVIKNDRISFMTGETESAYINENTLYIKESTILTRMQVGHWETKEDDEGNLNTKWIGGN